MVALLIFLVDILIELQIVFPGTFDLADGSTTAKLVYEEDDCFLAEIKVVLELPCSLFITVSRI